MLYECPVCLAVALRSAPYEIWPPPVELTAIEPPYENSLGMPSYEVCASCAFEFGNDDNPGTASPVSFAEYRLEWIKAGRPLHAGGRRIPEGAFCRLNSDRA